MSIELPVATRNRRDMTEKLLKATLNPNTHTIDNRNLIPDFGTDFSPLWSRQIQFTGVMAGCLLENITAARNKFTTANNEWYTANNVIHTIHKITSSATINKCTTSNN